MLVRLKNGLGLIAIAVTLAGCGVVNSVAEFEKKPVSQVEKSIEVSSSEFDKDFKFSGPLINTLFENGIGNQQHFLIRGWVAKKDRRKVNHQLYVIAKESKRHIGKWPRFRTAQAEDAQSVKLVQIDHDVNCAANDCTYRETVGIGIADSFLREHKNKGFRIRLTGQSGVNRIIKVPSNYVKAYLNVVNKFVNRTPTENP